MASHKAHIPRRRLRAAYVEQSVEMSRLRRAYGVLEAQWSETFQELIRLQEMYEPVPGTAWGIVNAAYEKQIVRADTIGVIDALEAWDPPSADAATEEILVSAIQVGIDPSQTGPSGIAVIKVSEDGTAEVVHDESR